MTVEVWKPIPDTGDLYEASSLGRIRSKDRVLEVASRWGGTRPMPRKGRVIKPWRDSNGYLVVYTCFDGNRIAVNVHRLVARAFLPGNGDGLDVNHKDGDKANNRPANLEWATRSENMRHAQAVGLWDNRRPVIARPANGGCPILHPSVNEAARVIGGAQPSISRALATGGTSHGHRWEYANAA